MRKPRKRHERLRSSWIEDEQALEVGLKRVDSAAEGVLVGRNGVGHYGGIVFPCFDKGKPVLYVLRRDRSDYEAGRVEYS